MSGTDTQMMAMVLLILFLGGLSRLVAKEMTIPFIGILLAVVMVWGDDICSRQERLEVYTQWFNGGGEIICQDDNSSPLLISKKGGWELKGKYLFKGNNGVEIVEDHCEILNHEEPHCIALSTQITVAVAAAILFLGWIVWFTRKLSTMMAKSKEDQQPPQKNK